MIVIPGNPVPKARARVVNGRAFTPQETSIAEEIVRAHVLAARRALRLPVASGPVKITLRFFRGDAHPCDLDNLVKMVLDALRGVVYRDDRQVMELRATKAIDRDNPRTELEVNTHG